MLLLLFWLDTLSIKSGLKGVTKLDEKPLLLFVSELADEIRFNWFLKFDDKLLFLFDALFLANWLNGFVKNDEYNIYLFNILKFLFYRRRITTLYDANWLNYCCNSIEFIVLSIVNLNYETI